jgi:hypothetical protein
MKSLEHAKKKEVYKYIYGCERMGCNHIERITRPKSLPKVHPNPAYKGGFEPTRWDCLIGNHKLIFMGELK